MKFFSVLIFCFILGGNVYAAPDISAERACLMIQETGEIIYEYNGDVKSSMASTTKIMTALIAVECCNLSDEAVVSDFASRQEGSSAYLGAGDRIPVKELLYGLMLNSGNDAAVVIAEHVSGSVEAFAYKMTERAKELGAVNTCFKNPNGLDEEGHFTTAEDLAIISREAMKNEVFREIVSTTVHKTDYSAGTLYFTNHNKLLKMYEGCTGIKTGYTKKTGRCLVSSAEKDGVELICVTLDASDDWNDHKKLLDYGFEKVRIKQILKKGQKVKDIKCDDGTYIPVVVSDDFYIPSGGKKIDSEIILHTVPDVDSSVDKGDKIGECEILYNGIPVGCLDLNAGKSYVRKKTFFETICLYLKNIVR